MKAVSRALGAMLLLALSLSAAITVTAAPDRQQPGVLLPDQPQESELDDMKGEETWTFEGQADTLVVIDMRADPRSSLDPHLSLRSPEGDELAYDDDGGLNLDSRIGPFLLPTTGTYSVVAGRFSGSGVYTIQLTVIEALAVIDIGQPVTGVLSAEHTADYYLLPSVETPTLVRLLAPFDSDHVPPLFEVFGPDGLVSSSEYLDRPEIDPLLLLPDITYTVVANWDGRSSSAPYELRLETSRVDMLTPGAPQTGKLSDANFFQQTHYFQGEAGQRLIISITTEDPISPSFDISSLDGSTYLLNTNGTATRAISVEIEVPNSLAYQIQVYDGSYNYVEGTYTISIEVAGTRTLSK